MNAKPTFARPHVVTTIVAAALSAVIAIGLLTAVVGLFERDGTPFEQVVIAEHACTNYVFVSEREACVRLFLAASRIGNARGRTNIPVGSASSLRRRQWLHSVCCGHPNERTRGPLMADQRLSLIDP